MKHLIVINPHSFPAVSDLNKIRAELTADFSALPEIDYQIYVSRYPRDAIAAVNNYMREIPEEEMVRIYAVGGNGILFDCLNGMVDFPNTELTNIPYGSANDFIRAFGEYAMRDFRDIKKLVTGTARSIDIIHCGSNYALNEVNIGIVGQSMIYANTLLRGPHCQLYRRHTPIVYSVSAFRSLLDVEVIRQRYEVCVDGQDFSGGYSNIQISNGPCNGGDMIPTPYALPNDGFLDVIFSATQNRLEIARVFGDYTSGRFEKHKNIFLYKRCRDVEVRSECPMRVELDGEAFFTQEIKIKLVPGKIRFVAPDGVDFVDYSCLVHKKAKRSGGGKL